MLNTVQEPQFPSTGKPRRQVVKNIVFSLLTKTQGAIFAYLITRLLLRALSVADYGFYSVLFAGTLTNLSMLVQLGVPNLLVRFIPEFFSQSRYRPIHRLFRVANFMQIGLAVILLSVVWIFAPTIAGWIHFAGRESVLRVFAVGALGYVIAENFRSLLRGLFRQHIIFRISLTYNALRLAAIFAVTIWVGSLIAVVIVEGSLFVVSVLLFWGAYHRHITPLVEADKRPETDVRWGRYTRYAGLCYTNEVGATLLSNTSDLFLVTGFLGGFQAGLYGLSVRIMIMVQQLLPNRILGDVIEPLFFSEYGASKENARLGFTLLTKISLLVTLPIGIWLGFMSRPVIVNLFDPQYAEAAGILMVQGMFLPMDVIRFALGLMLQNAERIDVLIYSKITGVVKILIGIWLVPIYGVMGMVWITALALTAQNVILYLNILINLRAGTDHLGVLRLLLNAALSALFLLLVRDYFHGLIGLVLSVPAYALVYLAINLVHKTFRPSERDFINSHLRRPVWKF